MEGKEDWMGDSCRGLWMEIESWIGRKDRQGDGGVKMFDRHEEDEMGKERSGGSGEDDRGQLTLKLDVL